MKIKTRLMRRLIFIDESGTNLAMTRRYARSEKGERARGSAPVNYGQNVTMIGAVDKSSVVAAMTVDGSTDGDVFLTFIEQVLVPELREGDVVIMDNLGAHKTTAVQDAIVRAKAELLFLSPYSPDFSPIEQCWSKIKTYLRAQAARTREKLDECISTAIELITVSDLLGWFNRCGYCLE